MKANKVGKDFNRSIGIKYPMATDTPKYPFWMPWAFWTSTAVFAVVIFGLIWRTL